MSRQANCIEVLLLLSMAMWFTEALTVPSIRFEPEKTVYTEGESVTVRCVTEAISGITGYTFYNNGVVVLDNSKTNILTHSSLKKSDSGMYVCTYFKDDQRSPERSIHLRVVERPSSPLLLVEPQRNVFIQHESAVLQCQPPRGHNVIAIHLYHNDGYLFNSNQHGGLNLTNLQTSNSGSYSCDYEVIIEGQKIKSYPSSTLSLIVTEPLSMPSIRLEPEKTVYTEGDRVTVRCVTEAISGITGYTFYKDGAVVLDNSKTNILTHSSLKKSDSGMYACTYVTENQRSPEGSINLIVVERPSSPLLLVEPQRNVFIQHESAVLQCQPPRGHNVIAIHLYHNDGYLFNSNQRGGLNLENIQTSNSGNYSCEYEVSKEGQIVKSYPSIVKSLIVIDLPPTPRLHYAYRQQNESTQVELACEVDNPSFSQIYRYNFYRNGIKIGSSDQINHFTFNYTMSYNGCYFCRTVVTVSEQEILSPKSSEKFLSLSGEEEGRCQEMGLSYSNVLSNQDLKLYGSILAGKLLVLSLLLITFGLHLLLIRQRKQKFENHDQ